MSRPFLAMVLFLVLAGCSSAGSSPAASGGTASELSAVPSTVEPTATPEPPEPPAPSLGEPPTASLAAEGGDPVAGSLGSFTWGGGGSDSPWLPGAPIKAGVGERLTLTLAGDVPVTDWAAKRVAAGTADGVGAVAIGTGTTTPISFPVPGPGRWSVQVVITFGDDLGSAAYYWEVSVT